MPTKKISPPKAGQPRAGNLKRAFLSGLIIIILGFLILVGIRLFTPEDTWIKDDRGVWIKHGQPKDTPAQVSEQQKLIETAIQKLEELKKTGVDVAEGPCLGTIAPDWVADIAHLPRKEIDDQPQNQCPDFISSQVHHYIELNEKAEVIRIQ